MKGINHILPQRKYQIVDRQIQESIKKLPDRYEYTATPMTIKLNFKNYKFAYNEKKQIVRIAITQVRFRLIEKKPFSIVFADDPEVIKAKISKIIFYAKK